MLGLSATALSSDLLKQVSFFGRCHGACVAILAKAFDQPRHTNLVISTLYFQIIEELRARLEQQPLTPAMTAIEPRRVKKTLALLRELDLLFPPMQTMRRWKNKNLNQKLYSRLKSELLDVDYALIRCWDRFQAHSFLYSSTKWYFYDSAHGGFHYLLKKEFLFFYFYTHLVLYYPSFCFSNHASWQIEFYIPSTIN